MCWPGWMLVVVERDDEGAKGMVMERRLLVR